MVDHVVDALGLEVAAESPAAQGLERRGVHLSIEVHDAAVGEVADGAAVEDADAGVARRVRSDPVHHLQELVVAVLDAMPGHVRQRRRVGGQDEPRHRAAAPASRPTHQVEEDLEGERAQEDREEEDRIVIAAVEDMSEDDEAVGRHEERGVQVEKVEVARDACAARPSSPVHDVGAREEPEDGETPEHVERGTGRRARLAEGQLEGARAQVHRGRRAQEQHGVAEVEGQQLGRGAAPGGRTCRRRNVARRVCLAQETRRRAALRQDRADEELARDAPGREHGRCDGARLQERPQGRAAAAPQRVHRQSSREEGGVDARQDRQPQEHPQSRHLARARRPARAVGGQVVLERRRQEEHGERRLEAVHRLAHDGRAEAPQHESEEGRLARGVAADEPQKDDPGQDIDEGRESQGDIDGHGSVAATDPVERHQEEGVERLIAVGRVHPVEGGPEASGDVSSHREGVEAVVVERAPDDEIPHVVRHESEAERQAGQEHQQHGFTAHERGPASPARLSGSKRCTRRHGGAVPDPGRSVNCGPMLAHAPLGPPDLHCRHAGYAGAALPPRVGPALRSPGGPRPGPAGPCPGVPGRRPRGPRPFRPGPALAEEPAHARPASSTRLCRRAARRAPASRAGARLVTRAASGAEVVRDARIATAPGLGGTPRGPGVLLLMPCSASVSVARS